MTVCWRKFDGLLHPSSTTIWSERKVHVVVFTDIWWDMFFSNSVKLLSHYVSIKFLYSTPFLFLQASLFINSISSLLACLSLEFSVAFHLGFHVVSPFLFFVFFRMLWMLIIVKKAKLSLRKTMIAFGLSWPWSAPCKRLSLPRKKNITLICLVVCLLSPLFSLKDIACHVFTHEVSNWNKHFSCNVTSLSHTRLA